MNAPSQQLAHGPVASGFAALARDYRVRSGHFDELRAGSSTPDAPLAVAWSALLANLPASAADALSQRQSSLERQVHDNGVTYNVYAQADRAQRPWSLDLFPLLVSNTDWQHIAAGVRQRAGLMEALMRDIYGPQSLVKQAMIPSALVHGHPGYLRALHGVPAVGGRFLHVISFDLARGPDGLWWLVSQRAQAPSGLGYLLENRLIISNQFSAAFERMPVHRLADTYRTLMHALRASCPGGPDPHLALLSPGPYNETYFEHAYLARYLGLTLVQGSDLLVRNQRLFLKTIKGLVPVHGLLKRVDDAFLDPLELRADSTLGVPGLLQAIRAGHVLVANAPGAAVLESPALLGFLPALAQHVLQEELRLPAVPTWWCGEAAALEPGLAKLSNCVIKPTYPGSQAGFATLLGTHLDASGLQQWRQRIRDNPSAHTLQSYLPLSQLPTWRRNSQGVAALQARSAILRVFAVADGQNNWQVLPGGLARVARDDQDLTGMQIGGSSADVWALSDQDVGQAVQPPHLNPASLMQGLRMVSSRAAEHLYWLGRYTERTENALRLARLCLHSLHSDAHSCAPLLHWLDALARANGLVGYEAPKVQQAPAEFERDLIDRLASPNSTGSVGFCLQALKQAAGTVRERLSLEHWRIITKAEEALFEHAARGAEPGKEAHQHALQLLNDISERMAAVTGAQTDRMVRDDGWRLLSIGRHIERLGFLATALDQALDSQSLPSSAGFDALITLFDSDISFHAQYQQSRETTALIEQLVLDADNPRSLAWVSKTLRGRLRRLADSTTRAGDALASPFTKSEQAQAADLRAALPDGLTRDLPFASPQDMALVDAQALRPLLRRCITAAREISDDISALYFSHTQRDEHLVGSL